MQTLRRAENVIVVVALPQISDPLLSRVSGRDAFETPDNPRKVAGFGLRHSENMAVIWHQAVSENKEPGGGKFLAHDIDKYPCQSGVRQDFAPIGRAYRQKKVAPARVTRPREAMPGVEPIHKNDMLCDR